eukprot:TRINITY_DN16266_c0_g1_i1.p1 TRINITY_DN16266_c0_g1~~TRINITY_DN16266_c0_g1_i1.p1  ORF type:complete len:113 (+),score=26.04 TRINITY_DN16266_c0_g1_i1:216-554(+)
MPATDHQRPEEPEDAKAPLRCKDVPELKYVCSGTPAGNKKELLRRLEQGAKVCNRPNMRRSLEISADAVREELYLMGAMIRPPPPSFMERLTGVFGDDKDVAVDSSARQVRF